MAYKSKKERKRSYGGKAEKGNLYNAKGSPAAESIDAKSDGFKRGGAKRADGGSIPGRAAGGHLGKRARGGKIGTFRGGLARGGSPMSAAHKTTPPGASRGSPGENAPTEPD